jgi:glycosyltransferase involved in cell wall biosynthesis
MIEVHNRADVALSLCRRYPGVPVSLVCHNDPLAMRGLQTGPERRHALRRLAGIVCVSDHLARRLIAHCADAAPVVIPNGIDLAALPPPVAPRQNLILFAGRVVADKGADAFVSACRLALPALPGWHAEMIGADRFHPDARQTKFTAALASAARAVPVTMSGYRPAAEVMVAMARAAIVVVPSRWEEPFGLTALEAMANGAALICSNRGGLAEVTGDVAIPCDPDDPAGMAAAIRHLAGDAAERARRGAAGRARAQAFDLARTEVALDAYRDRLNPDRMERGQDA